MQGDLSASIDQISWVVTGNIVASAIGIPPTAWLSARFGRKRLFLFCIALFIASCLLLSFSATLEEVVLWRILQGLSGAPLIAITQAIALDIYPRERQGMAMAVWSVGLIVGPVAAPTVGGYLTELGDWRLVFMAMVPLAVFSFFASLAVVPEWPAERGLRFDWFGFVAVTFGIGAAQLTIDQGQRLDWFDSNQIIVMTVIAGFGLYIFIAHILTARNPFLDPSIFRDRNFSVGLITMFFYSPLIYIPMVLMPNMLEDLRDFPALTIGLLLLPRGLGQIAGLSIAGRIVAKVDCRKLLVVSLLLQTFTTWAMSQLGSWDRHLGYRLAQCPAGNRHGVHLHVDHDDYLFDAATGTAYGRGRAVLTGAEFRHVGRHFHSRDAVRALRHRKPRLADGTCRAS